MARICRACFAGGHPDCTRWLWRDDTCECRCEDAPRQLSLPMGDDAGPGRSVSAQASGQVRPDDEEVPW